MENNGKIVLYDKNDIAEILKCSVTTAYRLMRSEIPSIRMGKLIRVRPVDLEQYLSMKVEGGFINNLLQEVGTDEQEAWSWRGNNLPSGKKVEGTNHTGGRKNIISKVELKKGSSGLAQRGSISG